MLWFKKSIHLLKTIVMVLLLLVTSLLSPSTLAQNLSQSNEGVNHSLRWTSGNSSDIARCRALLWPNHVPYLVVGPFTPRQRYTLHQTIGYLQTLSTVRFEEIWREPEDIAEKYVEILHAPDPECSANVGAVAVRKAVVHLSLRCFSQEDGLPYASHVMHEMLHVLGFAHEHQRLDRDAFLTINPNVAATLNFQPSTHMTLQECINDPYDFESLMQYPLNITIPVVGGEYRIRLMSFVREEDRQFEERTFAVHLVPRDIVRIQVAYEGHLDSQYCTLANSTEKFLVGQKIKWDSCKAPNASTPMFSVGSEYRRCFYPGHWTSLGRVCSPATLDEHPVSYCNFENGSNCQFLFIDGQEWRWSRVNDSLIYDLNFDATLSESFGSVVSYRRLPSSLANQLNLTTDALDMASPHTCVRFSYFYTTNDTTYVENAVTIRVFAEYQNKEINEVDRFLVWSTNKSDKPSHALDDEEPQVIIDDYYTPKNWIWSKFYLPQYSNLNYNSKLWEKRIVWSVSFVDEKAAITSGEDEIAMFGVALDEIVVHQCEHINFCFCNIH